MNDARQTRNREIAASPVLDAIGQDRPNSDGPLVVTVTAAITGATNSFSAQPLDIGGAETAGTAFTKANNGGPVIVANTGSGNIPSGTVLLAHPVGGRNLVTYFG